MIRIIFIATLILAISGQLFSQSDRNRVSTSDTTRADKGKEKMLRHDKQSARIRHEIAKDTITPVFRIQKGDTTITRTRNPNRPQENIENPFMRVRLKEE